MTISELAGGQCVERTERLSAQRVAELISVLDGWGLNESGQLQKTFKFPDFHKTMEFVNAVAAVANGQNHHPDMQVSYNRCTVCYSTHSVGGLSENDFICAARVETIGH